MRSALLRSAALAAAVGMWSCSGGGSSSNSGTPTSPTPTSPAPTPAPAPTAPTVAINIVGSDGNTAYQPNPVKANTGDTLLFKNNDSTAHHVVMDDGSADLGEIAPGASRSATLKGAGGNFHCTIHPSMVGSVNGATAPEPPPTEPYNPYRAP